MRKSPTKILVSIIINCYNGDLFLKEALDSVLAQTYQNWEIIFWDNQSTDESAKIYNSYREPKFHYFKSSKHTVLGEARELAVRKSHGDWIAFLDCDDLWLPDKLIKQVEIIQEEEGYSEKHGGKLGLVYCRSGIIHNGSINYQQPGQYYNAPLPEGDILTDLLFVENFCYLLSAILSKEAYQEVGGFPKSYTQAEDYYLFVGVAAKYRSRVLQEVFCFYRIHNNNLSLRQKVLAYEETLMVFNKWEHFSKVSSKQKKIRVRKLCTYVGLMLIFEDKAIFKGIHRILKKGDILFGIKLISLHLHKRLNKYIAPLSNDNVIGPYSNKDLAPNGKNPLREKKKILLIIPTIKLGGMERVASILSEEWAKKHDVYVCVFDSKDQAFPIGGKLINLSITSHTSMWSKVTGLFKKCLSLNYSLREIKPDYILTFGETASLPSIFACFFSGCLGKLSISLHTSLDFVPKVHKFAIAFLYDFSNRLLTPSVAARIQLINQLHIQASKCQVCSNPIDLDLIDKQNIIPIQKEYEDIGPIILAAGHLLPVKGFDRLIETFAILGQTYPGKLVILGEGPERQRLESRVVELDLCSRVLMPGEVENPFTWMSKADAYILSSHSEGWGMVILEAFVCKCPVVSFDCETGPNEIITDHINGLLVNNGDITGLAAAITEVLNNTELRNQLITNGIEYAKNYSVVNVAPLWLRGHHLRLE
jgi:glycosyltransferase involved in cell wall biosynthesis